MYVCLRVQHIPLITLNVVWVMLFRHCFVQATTNNDSWPVGCATLITIVFFSISNVSIESIEDRNGSWRWWLCVWCHLAPSSTLGKDAASVEGWMFLLFQHVTWVNLELRLLDSNDMMTDDDTQTRSRLSKSFSRLEGLRFFFVVWHSNAGEYNY